MSFRIILGFDDFLYPTKFDWLAMMFIRQKLFFKLLGFPPVILTHSDVKKYEGIIFRRVFRCWYQFHILTLHHHFCRNFSWFLILSRIIYIVEFLLLADGIFQCVTTPTLLYCNNSYVVQIELPFVIKLLWYRRKGH